MKKLMKISIFSRLRNEIAYMKKKTRHLIYLKFIKFMLTTFFAKFFVIKIPGKMWQLSGKYGAIMH
jgi:hypothetical protein